MASNAENIAQLKEDIVNNIQNLQPLLDSFVEIIRNKHVVIFLGNTRSGKSTLVKFLFGVELIAVESDVRMEYRIQEKYQTEEDGIGHGSQSCTTVPKVSFIEGTDIAYMDAPGFGDNRGIVQEISNALFISQIKFARTVKFVLVFDINEITTDNISNFTSCLEQVQSLVSNYEDLQNSFSAVFTKDWRQYSQDEISGLLYQKIINQEELDVDKVLVQALADNPNRIGIFKMPTQLGDVSNNLSINIESAVDACESLTIADNTVRFSLSDRAHEILLQIYPEYTDTNYFKGEVERIVSRYSGYFDVDRYVFASYNDELSTTRNELQNILSQVESQINLERVCLINIRVSLMELIGESLSNAFLDNFKFVCILNRALLMEQQVVATLFDNYKNTLLQLKNRINTLLLKINSELQDRKRTKYKYVAAGSVGAVGAVPTAIGIGRVVDPMIKTGNVLKNVTTPCANAFAACESVVGTAASAGGVILAVGAVSAAAGGAYVLYKETTGKRNECRRAQNRN